jgi:hypothetical protein
MVIAAFRVCRPAEEDKSGQLQAPIASVTEKAEGGVNPNSVCNRSEDNIYDHAMNCH